jgi:O-antigen ligase
MHAMSRQSAFWDGPALRVMEWGTYVFVLLMFAGRFGTLRELGLYIPALLWLLKAVIRRTPSFAWRTPLFAVLVLFCISAVLSSLQSPDMVSSLAALKREHLKLLILYAVIATVFADKDALSRFGRVFAVAALVYLAVGSYRIGEDLTAQGRIDYMQVRYYASVYLYLLPPLFVQALDSASLLRPLWAAGCIGMVSAMVLISVRGVWLSLAGAAALWVFAARDRFRGIFSLRSLTVFVLVTVLLVLLALVLFPSQFSLIRGHTFESLQMSLRLDTWDIFLALSFQRPLLGHGLDDQAMSRHYHEAFSKRRGAAPAILNPTTPHNQFIKILYQQGLLGLLLYLALLALGLKTLYRAFRKSPLDGASLVPLAFASVILAEYVMHCFFEDRSLTPLAVLIGVAGACLSRGERS